MSKCKECGSYAINNHLHGRDGSDLDLCDVCYWRKRAATAQEELTAARRTAQHWKEEHLAGNAEIDKLRTALEKIASFSQDTNLLWWQEEARKVLEA